MNKEQYIQDIIIQTLQDTITEFDGSITLEKPTKLYKYRKCTRNNINNLKNCQAWFSSPLSWNDKVDCTILLDFEKFCEEYENNPNNIMLESIKRVIKIFENKLGIKIKVSEEELKNSIKYFNQNGTINDEGKEQLESNCSKEEIEQYSLFESQMNTILTSMEFENVMKDLFYFNNNIRNNINAYCLSETSTNNTQWARYADEEKGFCIEYTLPSKIDNDFIKNLYPIIYAKKEEINFVELFFELANIGINKEELKKSDIIRKIILSLLTKEPKWESEEEWRIILNKGKYPNNLIDFNFVTAIILGADINDYNKRRLLKIAREQNLKVYQRRMNASHSDFIVEEINI
jgi:hypothetical protein